MTGGQEAAASGHAKAALEGFVRMAETVNERIGHAVSWCVLACVLVCFAVVALRYILGVGYVWMQELYVWQHAIVFMVGAGYTYQRNGHVRVDLLYANWSARTRAWVDLVGVFVALLPWLAVLVWTSLAFVTNAWRLFEGSPQAGGMPGYFLLKTVIWVFAAVVGLQGLVVIARCWLFLGGDEAYRPQVGQDD